MPAAAAVAEPAGEPDGETADYSPPAKRGRGRPRKAVTAAAASFPTSFPAVPAAAAVPAVTAEELHSPPREQQQQQQRVDPQPPQQQQQQTFRRAAVQAGTSPSEDAVGAGAVTLEMPPPPACAPLAQLPGATAGRQPLMDRLIDALYNDPEAAKAGITWAMLVSQARQWRMEGGLDEERDTDARLLHMALDHRRYADVVEALIQYAAAPAPAPLAYQPGMLVQRW